MIHERDLQSKCLAWVRDRGIYTINTHGDGWNGNGTPDLTLCVNGRFVCAELKVGENSLSGAQRIHAKGSSAPAEFSSLRTRSKSSKKESRRSKMIRFEYIVLNANKEPTHKFKTVVGRGIK